MMRKPRPLAFSAIPATATGPVSRPVSAKRVHRLRLNWFVVGSVFGVGISFFMNFMITMIVLPEYEAVMQHRGDVAVTEADKGEPAAPLGASAAVTQVATAAAAPQPQGAAYPRILALKIGKGDTLVDMLMGQKVPKNEAHNVVAALIKQKFDPNSLKVGQKIQLTLARNDRSTDHASVQELAIRLPNLSAIELQRLENGGFGVSATKESLANQAYHAVGTVKTSFSQAASDAGIPMAVMNELIKAYSYDVDFQRDIHPGDKIEVLMDRKVSASGAVGGYGAARYAALVLQGKKLEIYRFNDGTGELAWFDPKGNTIKKSLLRTPIDGAHITSGFGMRIHPLLGYSKFHKGVDFGAAEGTPIYAAGNGVIEQRGWVNGYGNFVLLKHNNVYETAYAHCSRFAPGLAVGSRVKQGQIIAYVGMTGEATGPHLHYEVRVDHEQVNPVAKQFNMANALTGKQLNAFKANKTGVSREIAQLDHPAAAKTASAAPAKPQAAAQPVKTASR